VAIGEEEAILPKKTGKENKEKAGKQEKGEGRKVIVVEWRELSSSIVTDDEDFHWTSWQSL